MLISQLRVVIRNIFLHLQNISFHKNYYVRFDQDDRLKIPQVFFIIVEKNVP